MLLVKSSDEPALELLVEAMLDTEPEDECPQLARVAIDMPVLRELGIEGRRGRWAESGTCSSRPPGP